MPPLRPLLACCLAVAVLPASETPVDPLVVAPTEAGWESGYRSRLEALVNARTWPIGGGNADTDDGKREWPSLLAEMWKVRGDASAIDAFIADDGARLIASPWAGTFYKAFSCPGYTMYYHRFRDRLPSSQIAAARDMITMPNHANGESGWDQMTRPDHHMDPIWDFTEFNSENFNWMARLAGYLWAQELGDATRQARFEAYLRNWIRALYCAGRVEWDSNNYWGYCVQPILVLYEHAQDPAVRRRAKAALDWMAIEAALHHLDGFQAGADVRAKPNAYAPFAGSVWPYTYVWYATSGHHPSFSQSDAVANMDRSLVGYLPWSSYRPPQVAIDIAHRDFALPVELWRAKPFYHLDADDYADWRGDTARGRRFEFETLHLDRGYLLSSLATERPDGYATVPIGGLGGSSQKPFSEQSLWRLAVRGSRGPVQIFGNSGPPGSWGRGWDEMVARQPHEQIGQYRNVMMRLVDGVGRMWVGIPDAVSVRFDGDTAVADLGSDVYLAVIPWGATGRSSKDWHRDGAYTLYEWHVDAAALGGLVLEVGTRADHGSFDAFRSAIAATALSSPAADRLRYVATSGRTLEMRHTGTTTYAMADGTVIDPAGKLPEVWRDGERVDFATWNAAEVVHGERILHQGWGSGELWAAAGGEGLHVAIDLQDASVSYATFAGPVPDPGGAVPPPPPSPSAPVDNPLATHYAGDAGYPAWTDAVAWDRAIDMSAYAGGASDFERFENARDELAAQGGGVLYYPAGVYDFSTMPADGPGGRGLMLKPGVVIRGEAPSGDRDAVDGSLALGTVFDFGFRARPGGSVPHDWAFVGLDPSAGVRNVDRVGVCWVHLRGGTVFFGFDVDWGATWATAGSWKSAKVKATWADRVPDGSHPMDAFAGGGTSFAGAGDGRIVFGCVIEDGCVMNDAIDEGFGADGFAPFKFGARIQVYGSRVIVANNLLARSRRNFTHQQTTRYVTNGNVDSPTWGERTSTVLFDYGKTAGIDVNKELLGLARDGYFQPGVIVRDNRVYNHGHKGFNLSGAWVSVLGNVNDREYLDETVPADYGASGTYELTLDGYTESQPGGSGAISDNLSRAFDLGGRHLWVDGSWFDDTGSDPGNDGEGILCQLHGGTEWYSWALTGNTHERGGGENGYMGGYDVDQRGALVAWNTTPGWVGSAKAGELYDAAYVANDAAGGVRTTGSIAPLTADPPGSPAAPADVTARVDGDHVVIAWRDTTDAEVGFRVERRIGAGAWTTIAYRPRQAQAHPDNPPAWHDHLAPRGRDLRYRVVAIGADDLGGVSAETPTLRIGASGTRLRRIGVGAVPGWSWTIDPQDGSRPAPSGGVQWFEGLDAGRAYTLTPSPSVTN